MRRGEIEEDKNKKKQLIMHTQTMCRPMTLIIKWNCMDFIDRTDTPLYTRYLCLRVRAPNERLPFAIIDINVQRIEIM